MLDKLLKSKLKFVLFSLVLFIPGVITALALLLTIMYIKQIGVGEV